MRIKGKLIFIPHESEDTARIDDIIQPYSPLEVEFNGHPGYLHALFMAAEVHTEKNHDYCGGAVSAGDHPLANFMGVEEYGQTVEGGFVTRLFDKIQRFKTWAKGLELKVPGEGIYAIGIDIANYFFLLLGYLQEKRGQWIKREEV